jgi:hypothetical protein
MKSDVFVLEPAWLDIWMVNRDLFCSPAICFHKP